MKRNELVNRSLHGLLAVALILAAWVPQCRALDLQPRRWSHLPVGMSFAGAGYAYTNGDIAFDPVLLLEDVEFDMHAGAISYIHTFAILGKSARIDLLQGYADAKWTGLVDGVPASTRRTGFSDTNLRFAMQLFGAPPMKGKEFRAYRAAIADCETVVGIGLVLQIPTGHYEEDKLLNLGSNRFTIRPQLGVVHNRGKWSMELTGSAWIYTDNDDFFGGNTLELNPLYTFQGHLVYTFRPGLWLGAGVGYGFGGESTLNGVGKDDRKGNLGWGVRMGIPINKQVGLTIGYLGLSRRVPVGIDSDTVIVGLSFRW